MPTCADQKPHAVGGGSNSGAFEPGSWGYAVFQGSAPTWHAAAGTIDDIFWIEAAGFGQFAGGAIGELAFAAEETEAVEGVQLARSLGDEGEAAVRQAYEIGEKTRISINGGYRIPDGLTNEALSEVKNVDYQAFTSQLRDYSSFAQDNGLRFDLYLRPDTTVSGPLQQAIDKGLINRLTIPQ